MKRHRDGIAAALGLVLGVAAMVGMVVSGVYANAAGAEARGVQALFHAAGAGPAAPAALLASNDIKNEVDE